MRKKIEVKTFLCFKWTFFLYVLVLSSDRGILMTFGSGVYGCLGHGNYNDVAQVEVILYLNSK